MPIIYGHTRTHTHTHTHTHTQMRRMCTNLHLHTHSAVGVWRICWLSGHAGREHPVLQKGHSQKGSARLHRCVCICVYKLPELQDALLHHTLAVANPWVPHAHASQARKHYLNTLLWWLIASPSLTKLLYYTHSHAHVHTYTHTPY